MVTYVKDLYEQVLRKNAPKYSNLKIISGYSSAKFLEKVRLDFPHLKIELYIGMALEGISTQNHELYKMIQISNSHIQIFYQIESPKNHMKIFEFSNEQQSKTFVGSANFSENGFYFQREILTECDFNCERVFNEQLSISRSCLDENIANYIHFYDDKELEKKDDLPEDTNASIQPNSGNQMASDRRKKYISKMTSIRTKINPEYYRKFELSIVLPSESNWKWDRSGINAWNDRGVSELIETPKSPFNVLFPINNEFKVFTDNGYVYNAKLVGTENKRRLSFINLNLYEYVANHINLKEFRPISYEDLVKAQCPVLYFTRLNELEYIMSFYKQSY